MEASQGNPVAVPVQPTVVIQGPPPPTEPVVVKSKGINSQTLGSGIAQIVLGFMSIVFNAVAIGNAPGPAYASTGIWCGIMFIVTGSICAATGARKTKGWYIASMVLCIISASLTVFMIMQSFAGIFDPQLYRYCGNYHDYHYGSWGCNGIDPRIHTKQGIHGMLLVCAVLEAIFAIWVSALCCRVACCKTAPMGEMHTGPNVVYHAGTQPMVAPGQQVVMVQQGQPATMMISTLPATNQQQFVTVPQTTSPPAYEKDSYPTK